MSEGAYSAPPPSVGTPHVDCLDVRWLKPVRGLGPAVHLVERELAPITIGLRPPGCVVLLQGRVVAGPFKVLEAEAFARAMRIVPKALCGALPTRTERGSPTWRIVHAKGVRICMGCHAESCCSKPSRIDWG